MSPQIACSICRTTCSDSCYQRHKRLYACHNPECGLNYPENVIVDHDTFVLGTTVDSYRQDHPEQGRRPPRNEEGQRTNLWATPETLDATGQTNHVNHRGRSPYPRATNTATGHTRPSASNYGIQTHGQDHDQDYDLFEGSTLCSEGTEEEQGQYEEEESTTSSDMFTSIPDSRDHHHRSIRRSRSHRHQQGDNYTLPSETDAAVCLSTTSRGPSTYSRFRHAVRSLLCGFPVSRNDENQRGTRPTPRLRNSGTQGEQARVTVLNSRDSRPREQGTPIRARNRIPHSPTQPPLGEVSDLEEDDNNEVTTGTPELPPLTRQPLMTAESSVERAPEQLAGRVAEQPEPPSTGGESSRGGTTWVTGVITLRVNGPGDYTVKSVEKKTVTRYD
ncbi:hypothetical protein V8F33_013000 [Rhypophila sp. PSN 637]